MPDKKSYTIGELAEAADVTPRTIRYYVAEELLPPPEGEGRAASYRDEHLDRLALIKILKEEYLPLQEIRTLLSGLSHAAVVDLLKEKRRTGSPLPPAPNSAKEYLQRLLKLPAGPADRPGFLRHQLEARQSQAAMPPTASPAQSLERPAAPTVYSKAGPATHWQRVEIAPGVELHVREDLASGPLRQKVEQLIRLTREALK